MSEHTISRWNAIPLDRSDTVTPTNLKRGRPEDDQDDDDDDVSLVSRSPSPPPHDFMDVDENIHKYDEYYLRRPPPEVITVETKIKSTNKGFSLLAKLGWVEGQPVGLSRDGRTEPIPFHFKSDLTGLGKTSQDVRMIETTVSQRRGLDSERQQKESEEQRKLRENAVARKNALESEISSTLRAFYCALCDKQFKNVAQYDEHTNSYAHHHKARFQDMQANVRLKSKEDVDKRKEKERKREEKELRKIAAASGIKMPKPSTVSSLSAPLATSDPVSVSTSMEIDGLPIEPKKTGWATISGSQGSGSSLSSQGGFKKSGWATVGSSSSVTLPPTSHPTSAANPEIHPSTSSESPSAKPSTKPSHTPTFRNAGWRTLDTGSSQPTPATHTSATDASKPCPPSSVASSQGVFSRGVAPTGAGIPSASLGSSSRQWNGSFAPVSTPPPPPSQVMPPQPPPVPPPSLPPAPPETKPVRSNWQQFQKGAGRRK